MPELPDRPDLDHLRRQARELFRAAVDGQPTGIARLRAVSDRIILSTAQLAVAREYGFASWAALRTEVQRRTASRDFMELDDRWSFGGADAIETPAGLLRPVGLVVGPDVASMDCWLRPVPGWTFTDLYAAMAAMSAERQRLGFEDLVIIDDRGTRYTARVAGLGSGHADQETSLPLHLDPIPARECEWLELRNQAGATTRLVRSTRPTVRVSDPAPPSDGADERDMSIIAFHLINPRPGDDLPAGWSSVLEAAQRTDGPRLQFDLAAVLPPVHGVALRIDSLISGPDSWRVHQRATPGWWIYGDGGRTKRAAMSVFATDDVGGRYVSNFGGSTGRGDHEEMALNFQPRLDPLASTLTLTFRGTDDEVTVEVGLERSP